jgi:acyl-homoserine lactone acylase PvdQ
MTLTYRGNRYEVVLPQQDQNRPNKSCQPSNKGTYLMHLTYRGNRYQVMPTLLNENDRNISGQYRGVSMQLIQSNVTSVPQSSLRLTYRGASYLQFR